MARGQPLYGRPSMPYHEKALSFSDERLWPHPKRVLQSRPPAAQLQSCEASKPARSMHDRDLATHEPKAHSCRHRERIQGFALQRVHLLCRREQRAKAALSATFHSKHGHSRSFPPPALHPRLFRSFHEKLRGTEFPGRPAPDSRGRWLKLSGALVRLWCRLQSGRHIS